MAKFKIREGRREDCKEIRRLIQELADFEEMPDGPKISAEDIERDGFDTEPPLFQTFVVDSEEKPDVLVAYALYYYMYSALKGRRIFLEDICVTESHRGKGIGSALIRKVMEKGVETNSNDMDCYVLHWNPAKKLYIKCGATDITTDEKLHLFRMHRPEMVAVVSRK